MFKGIFSFSGRSGRLEYFVHSIADIFGILAVASAISFVEGQFDVLVNEVVVALALMGVILVGFVAETAATVRRFHDLGRSGWYLIGTLIPFYNIYLALILLFKKGQAFRNSYSS
jgi:uncharacterized membrane protein YhaH (DUF805 family)